MAVAEVLDTGVVVDHDLAALLEALASRVTDMPARAAVRVCRDVRRRFDAIETVKATELVGSDGDTRAAERALGDLKTSRAEARRRARRAKTAAASQTVRDKIAGGMTGEHVDVIANAAAKSGGRAALDDEFVQAVAATTPDQAKKVADEWIAKDAKTDDVQTEHDRQCALRLARRYNTATGLGAIAFEGDQASIKAVWAELVADANKLYAQDGGRDVPAGSHARTTEQRLYDAFRNRFTNATSGGSGDDSTPSSSARPVVVAVVPIEKLTGDDPDAVAVQIGTGPIADSVLTDYINRGSLVGAVFGVDGQPLWLGRVARIASKAQLLALIIRDKSCVLCGASHQRCEAHHLTPYNSPAQGSTNINNLALVCCDCHHRLHDNNQTLYRDRNTQTWKLRAATAAETAKRGREPPQRE